MNGLGKNEKKSREINGNSTPKTRIAEQYLKAIKDPKKGKRTIAKELFRLYPEIFQSVEAARSTIRFLSDCNGNQQRNRPHRLEFFDLTPETKEDLSWQQPYILPSGIKEAVVLGDFHGIYLNSGAVNEAIEAARGIKTAIINGDLLDNHWLGRWLKDPDAPLPEKEFEFVRKLLEKLRSRFDHIYFKEGNHDAWLKRYLIASTDTMPKAIQEKILESVKLSDFLKLDELKIIKIHNLQEIKFGDLSILHGHEKPGYFTPKFVAKSVMQWWQNFERKWDVKVLVNHHHVMDAHTERGFDGTFGKAWVNGCLCDLMPKYAPYTRWDHSIAIISQSNGVSDVKLVEV